ncbi:MAG TPA: BrnA antitoxin family protein [Stellaceae bacterium]|nr:BrnA antitoxin family protein [Stellaceae bacterium]
MAKKRGDDPASLPDDDNPEWTKEDFAAARPAAEILPEFIGENAAQTLTRRGRGRPRKLDKKVNQTLRLDADVLEAYRQQGKGWQRRINEVLREHKPHRRAR